MNEAAKRIADNVARIRERIARAAESAGRPPESVTMVAVTKYVGADLVRLLAQTGCRHFGESRPQELWQKESELRDLSTMDPPIYWHLIGHLQRNKVVRTLPLVHRIHSVDSLRLIEAIEDSAAALEMQVTILLEVNISGDPSKHGWAPDALLREWETWRDHPHLTVSGLMAMAGAVGGRPQAAREFEQLRQLRDQLARNAPPRVSLTELSMGMTGDYDLAIAAGATLVRIGSALFE